MFTVRLPEIFRKIKGTILHMKNTQLTYVRLPLEGAKNVRELGGYPAQNGTPTKWRSFLRADGLSRLTEDDARFLYDYGVRTVIDLRSTEEVSSSPDALSFSKGPVFTSHHISLAAEGNIKKATEFGITLTELYIIILKSPELTGQVLKLMAYSEGCTLFHCTAGKDRTGIIAMLLLSIAGVQREDIIANYQVSHTYIHTSLTFPPDFAETHPQLHALMDSPVHAITSALDFLEDELGGIKAYLLQCGLTAEEICLLQNKMMMAL